MRRRVEILCAFDSEKEPALTRSDDSDRQTGPPSTDPSNAPVYWHPMPSSDVVTAHEPAIAIRNLDFSLNGVSILRDVTLNLPRGARCLLIGSNGAGASPSPTCTKMLYIVSYGRQIHTAPDPRR